MGQVIFGILQKLSPFALAAALIWVAYLKVDIWDLNDRITDQNTTISNLTTDLDTSDRNLKGVQEQLDSALTNNFNLKNQVSSMKYKLEDAAKIRTQLQQQLATTNAKIDQYYGRQQVVFAKPGLVQRLEQSAFDEFRDDWNETMKQEQPNHEQD
ncbi:hypothetical protein EniLVp02_0050 [Vibrio phage EniLVp02]